MDDKNGKFETSNQPKSTDTEEKQVRTAQTLAAVGSVAGPVSLIIGGMLLSAIAVVCGIVSYRKITSVLAGENQFAAVAENIRKTAKLAIVIGCVAFVLNAVFAAYFMPEILASVDSASDFFGALGERPSSTLTWG